MRVLLLGVGMQGRAALHDLVQSDAVTDVIAADIDIATLRDHVKQRAYGPKVRCEHLNAGDVARLDLLMEQGVDVVIDLLPTGFINDVVRSALRHGSHVVNTFYINPALSELAGEAKANDLAILPEFGMDPGIDLVLAGELVRSVDNITELNSYGAGIPAPDAADNPLKYKVSWTLEGVLRSYYRPAHLIRDGRRVSVAPEELFRLENIHTMTVRGVGALEASPNGDALQYAEALGLDVARLRGLGRYTLRWPGHAEIWRAIVDLHLLDDDPVDVNGIRVDRKRFLAAALEPHLQYGDREQDLGILRVEGCGEKDGKKLLVAYQIVDRRDLRTGFSAMSRLVGYTASIGAQMIARGEITERGLLSPVTAVPAGSFIRALEQRGVEVVREERELE